MDREAESVALEKKHVHDVYERIAPHFSDTRYKAWPRVKEFLLELEPGSIVADVGCGNGKYLGINNQTFKIGSDCCVNLVDISAKRGHEAMVCDNLRLPYRSNCFDAVISIAVVHHFATVERRVQAIQELARICRPGGLVMIYVWALEQKQRQFDAQDVLVPWHLQPKNMRTRRSKGKQNSKTHNHNSSSSASDDEVKTNKKPDKALNGKTDGKLSKMKVHPAIVSAQNGGMRSRKTKTLQRHTTERDWLREKFPNRRGQLRSEESRVLRKSYSCEESVVLSAKPRVAKTRCQSDSGMSRRLMSRSSSVEEGERGGTMWDGFLQVFPASFSPTSSFRSEDDVTQGDVNSVFGDDDDDIDEDTKNQWCIINKDGSMGFYENGHKSTASGQSLKNRQSRSHLLLNGSGSCDSILPKHSKSLRNIKKRTSPLLSSQSLDERDFERTSSPRTSLEKFGANRRNLSSFSHNSEGAIDVKNLKGSDLKASTWSSDTSGFVSNGSVNGECSEATKKLLNWRKQQLKLNLRSDETKEKGFNSWNGVITKSLELLYKSEGKTSKKPVVGLNFTSARGEIFKPFKRRNRLSQSGSEKDLESSFDSVSSSDESLTTYPINPTKQSQLTKEQTPASDLRTRSISLTMLEKLMPKDFKFPESPLALSRKPSSESLSLNQDNPLELHDRGQHSQNVVSSRSEFRKRRPASNPNLRCIHQQERSKAGDFSLGQVQKEEDKTNPKNPTDASLYLRYYHVFKEGELTDLIERKIENLHIVKSYYDHANWCVVAEKVEVWRI